MKIESAIAAAVLFIFSACQTQPKNDATISGQLKNGAGKKIYFERITAQGDQPIDSTVADANGKFSISNPATELDYYLLRTDNKNVAYLILDGSESVTLNGDASQLESTYEVEGSKDTKLLLQLKRYDNALRDSLNRIYSEQRDENPFRKDSVGLTLQKLYESAMRRFAMDLIQSNFTSLVSLSASQYLNKHEDLVVLQQLADTLREVLHDNKYVNEYVRQIEELKRLPLGSLAPEIVLPSPEGKDVALSSLKGKIVVIDFWASWCGPCRRQMPEMAELYSDFRNKGLEIYGVSLDDNADAWKRAVQHDKMPWIQVSELKRWNSVVVTTYGIEEIPNTVLLDREGRIVAKGLEPRELRVKIEELLGKS